MKPTLLVEQDTSHGADCSERPLDIQVVRAGLQMRKRSQMSAEPRTIQGRVPCCSESSFPRLIVSVFAAGTICECIPLMMRILLTNMLQRPAGQIRSDSLIRTTNKSESSDCLPSVKSRCSSKYGRTKMLERHVKISEAFL